MALKASYFKKVFRFNFKARTSRGLMEDKTSWFIKLWDEYNPNMYGIGECGPLPGLSRDASPDFENVLATSLEKISALRNLSTDAHLNVSTFQRIKQVIPPYFPSITFGLETAWLDLIQGGKRIIFKNDFLKSRPIPINGLIWLGDRDFMMDQVHQKIAQGFTCIKLKVGGLDFDQECGLLEEIRREYPSNKIAVRLDANGAFRADEALAKLERLSIYDIHSIEQPIQQGQREMADICKKSPIPIALDEELIGYEATDSKKQLLGTLKPTYIILKPTLHGGFSGCQHWIEIAEGFGVGWWITSALETNVGLNAICQFAANYSVYDIPQGLGTGGIYENNIPCPLRVDSGNILLDQSKSWEMESLFNESSPAVDSVTF